MTDWFARAALHVTDVEASLRFYLIKRKAPAFRHGDISGN